MNETPEAELVAINTDGMKVYTSSEIGAAEGFLLEPVKCASCNEYHSYAKFIMLRLKGGEGHHDALIPEGSHLGQAILSGELQKYARLSLDNVEE